MTSSNAPWVEMQLAALRRSAVEKVIGEGAEFHPPSADIEVMRALYHVHPDPLVRSLANHVINLRAANETLAGCVDVLDKEIAELKVKL